MTTKSIQFWIEPNGVMQFAEIIEKAELANSILGTDSGAVVVEVDYNPANGNEVGHVSTLQQLNTILHCERIE